MDVDPIHLKIVDEIDERQWLNDVIINYGNATLYKKDLIITTNKNRKLKLVGVFPLPSDYHKTIKHYIFDTFFEL